jgi:hypothetical protein
MGSAAWRRSKGGNGDEKGRKGTTIRKKERSLTHPRTHPLIRVHQHLSSHHHPGLHTMNLVQGEGGLGAEVSRLRLRWKALRRVRSVSSGSTVPPRLALQDHRGDVHLRGTSLWVPGLEYGRKHEKPRRHFLPTSRGNTIGLR